MLKPTRSAPLRDSKSWIPRSIKSAELEKENGMLVWSFDVAQPAKKDLTEVWVDAITGKIIAVNVETPIGEKKEAAEDKAQKWLLRYKGR